MKLNYYQIKLYDLFSVLDNNFKKFNKYSELEHKKELYDFSTQINFRGHKQFINKYRNTSKNLLPNTIQKVRSYKKENRSTFLKSLILD